MRQKTATKPTQLLDEKICASCGRRFNWRKKWERDWEYVRFCSDACKRRGVNKIDTALENGIIKRLESMSAGKTICPSEPARKIAAEFELEDWRELMKPARRAARRLVAQDQIEITQSGRVVDASQFRGPIRLRLKNAAS